MVRSNYGNIPKGIYPTFDYLVMFFENWLQGKNNKLKNKELYIKELFENELMEKTDAYKNGNIVYLDPSIWYTATGGFTSTMKMVEEINSAIK